MLHVVSVPKGSRFIVMNSSAAGYFKEAPSTVNTHLSNGSFVGFEIPVPGCPRWSSNDLDVGWIANGAEHVGQKDVEQLDVDGVVHHRQMFTHVGTKRPQDPLPLPVEKQVFSLTSRFGTGSPTELWLSALVRFGSEHGCSVIRAGKLGTDTVTRPWKWSTGFRWLNQYLAIGLHCAIRLDWTLPTWSISYTGYKFNQDYTKFVKWTSAATRTRTEAQLDWDGLLDLGVDVIWGDSMTKTPTLSTTTNAYENLNEEVPVDISPFKLLDKSYIFSGNLDPVWGDLAYDCYSQIQLWNGNGIAYSKDLILIMQAVKDLVSLVKSLTLEHDIASASKDVASLFLSFRYGWYLTVKDTLSLIEADYARAYPMGRCKRSSAYTYFRNGYNVTARMSVYCRPYSDTITELGRLLSMFDFELTAENIWDFIPMSFVVDWFTGIGDVLARWDTLVSLDKYSIFLTGRSLRVTTTVEAEKITLLHGMVGTLSAKWYKRDYSTDIILPSLISSRQSTGGFNHWVEGAALVIQRA